MLEFRRAVSNARHAVLVADRVQCLADNDYDSQKVDQIRESAEATLEESLVTADLSY